YVGQIEIEIVGIARVAGVVNTAGRIRERHLEWAEAATALERDLISASNRGLIRAKPRGRPRKSNSGTEVIAVSFENSFALVRRIRPDKVEYQIITAPVAGTPPSAEISSGIPESSAAAANRRHGQTIRGIRHAIVFVTDAEVECQASPNLVVILEEKVEFPLVDRIRHEILLSPI